MNNYWTLRDVLVLAAGLGLDEVRQSLSSETDGAGGSLGGPISERPLKLPPNLEPVLSSAAEGVNLLPFDHFASVSAAPADSGVEKPEPFRLIGGGSESGGAASRDGRLERH